MEKKAIYDIRDICVACGKPTIPGDMLCEECKRLAEDEFYRPTKTDECIKNKSEQQIREINSLKIAVMLSDRREQLRLVRALQKLCKNAEIRVFTKKDKLIQAAKEYRFSILFLSETYGMESGIIIGKRIRQTGQDTCNLIYVTDTTDTLTLAAMWEMHISGILPIKFPEGEIETELSNLRYPV